MACGLGIEEHGNPVRGGMFIDNVPLQNDEPRRGGMCVFLTCRSDGA